MLLVGTLETKGEEVKSEVPDSRVYNTGEQTPAFTFLIVGEKISTEE